MFFSYNVFMGQRIIILLISLFCCLPVYSAQQENPYSNLVKHLGVTQDYFPAQRGGGLDYCERFFDNRKNEEPAMIVFVQGKSTYGEDNVRQLASPVIYSIMKHAKINSKKVLFLLPQVKNGWFSDEVGYMPSAMLAELIRSKIDEYDIPVNKVYLIGIEEGGDACYHIMDRNPELISKAVIDSSAGNVLDTKNIKGKFLVIHAENDDIVPLQKAKVMVKALKENSKTSVKFKILKEKGHRDAINYLANDEVLIFLFGHTSYNYFIY